MLKPSNVMTDQISELTHWFQRKAQTLLQKCGLWSWTWNTRRQKQRRLLEQQHQLCTYPSGCFGTELSFVLN